MSQSPDEIRAEIERTRRGLGSDVDALADKVTPSKIVDRQKSKVRRAFGSVSERVMGAADHASSSVSGGVSGAASDVSEHAHDLAHQAKAKAEGNPLAVGLIAFGVGLVAASLIPVSEKEKDLSEAIKHQAEPLVDEAKDVAKGFASRLEDPAKEAMTAVKDRATEGVEEVKGEASDATATVKERADEARGDLTQ
ncbi:DUF3618 domain-containing protein [Leucobacter sp. USHLN153]|uniref:DUF3618 domain-containing protein n=1 Tax=Leucobacter sp. USHLN153 TaxID=3081268 RepID=UPI003019BC2E